MHCFRRARPEGARVGLVGRATAPQLMRARQLPPTCRTPSTLTQSSESMAKAPRPSNSTARSKPRFDTVLRIKDPVAFLDGLSRWSRSLYPLELPPEPEDRPSPSTIPVVLRALYLDLATAGLWKFLDSAVGGYAHPAATWCHAMGASRMAKHLAEAIGHFPSQRIPSDEDRRTTCVMRLVDTRGADGLDPLARLDRRFAGSHDEMITALRHYLRAHRTGPTAALEQVLEARSVRIPKRARLRKRPPRRATTPVPAGRTEPVRVFLAVIATLDVPAWTRAAAHYRAAAQAVGTASLRASEIWGDVTAGRLRPVATTPAKWVAARRRDIQAGSAIVSTLPERVSYRGRPLPLRILATKATWAALNGLTCYQELLRRPGGASVLTSLLAPFPGILEARKLTTA